MQAFSTQRKFIEQIDFHPPGNRGIKTPVFLRYHAIIKEKHSQKG
jgi:hypothetical protein